MVRAGLGYLAAADAAQLPAAVQAEALAELEQHDAMAAAARAVPGRVHRRGGARRGRGLQRGVLADPPDRDHPRRRRRPLGLGQAGPPPTPRCWPRWPPGRSPNRSARVICLWTGKLPQEHRDAGDEQLLAASAAGLGLADLAGLFAEMYVRARGDLPDQDPGREFADREVKLATTIGGAGVMHGDLTAECAAAVAAVLDALSAPAGKEDDRTKGQRYHDALAEAMRRLTAANLVPERAGQPVKAWVHISLADLLLLDGDSALQEEWTERVRARWAARRAQASETGANDGAWLDGDAAAAIACDAAMAPIVTGDIDVDALEDLVRLCVELDGTAPPRRRRPAGRTRPGRHHRGLGRPRAGRDRQGRGPPVGPGRAGELPAAAAARRAAGRAEPAAGHRVRRDDPGRDPQRGAAAGPALPVGRRLHPARRRLRGAPYDAQGRRRHDVREGLRAALPVPPPGCDSPLGLDAGGEPGRHDERVEQEQDQGAPQPRTTRPAG